MTQPHLNGSTSQMAPQANLVLDAAERIFRDLADPQAIIHSRSDAWKQPLWEALEDAGLPLALTPEANGGHELPLVEGLAVVRAAGRAGLAIPLVDTMIAGWVLGHTQLQIPAGSRPILVPCQSRDVRQEGENVFVRTAKVPFGREATHFVLVAAALSGYTRVVLVPTSQCEVLPGCNLAGDPSDEVRFALHLDQFAKADRLTPDAVFLLGAVTRSLQIAGALETLLDLSVAYSQERVAFEKPIARFQAVQHNLARLSGEVAAAVAVAESAADALATLPADANELLLEVASAKIRCGEAAEAGARIAHQVHGAIGYTDEHVLHRYSLRALAWRDEFGNESTWARRLGSIVCGQSSAQLWNLLASR